MEMEITVMEFIPIEEILPIPQEEEQKLQIIQEIIH
jgi:hypothetical protein